MPGSSYNPGVQDMTGTFYMRGMEGLGRGIEQSAQNIGNAMVKVAEVKSNTDSMRANLLSSMQRLGVDEATASDVMGKFEAGSYGAKKGLFAEQMTAIDRIVKQQELEQRDAAMLGRETALMGMRDQYQAAGEQRRAGIDRENFDYRMESTKKANEVPDQDRALVNNVVMQYANEREKGEAAPGAIQKAWSWLTGKPVASPKSAVLDAMNSLTPAGQSELDQQLKLVDELYPDLADKPQAEIGKVTLADGTEATAIKQPTGRVQIIQPRKSAPATVGPDGAPNSAAQADMPGKSAGTSAGSGGYIQSLFK